jgi:hypothetical protein
MSTLVGMELSGRYRLDAQVGAGGMSTVYLAFDQTLERRVAIKLMHREIASDSDQLERFRREARSVAQRGALRTGRMGAEVHPDLCGLDLFPVRTHQDPQRRLEPHQLAGELDPDVGHRPETTRAGSVLTALSRAASSDAVVRLHR